MASISGNSAKTSAGASHQNARHIPRSPNAPDPNNVPHPDNCQVAVSLSLANAGASFPIAYRLYLPKDWAADPARRKKAGVPEEVTFRTKPETASPPWWCGNEGLLHHRRRRGRHTEMDEAAQARGERGF